MWRFGVTTDTFSSTTDIDTGSLINTTLRIYDDGQTAVFSQYFDEALAYMAAQDGDTAATGAMK